MLGSSTLCLLPNILCVFVSVYLSVCVHVYLNTCLCALYVRNQTSVCTCGYVHGKLCMYSKYVVISDVCVSLYVCVYVESACVFLYLCMCVCVRIIMEEEKHAYLKPMELFGAHEMVTVCAPMVRYSK